MDELSAYYMDYLCVDKHYSKKEIDYQLIQTHYYNQRYVNKNVYVNIFKREGEDEIKNLGIIPLCKYFIYGFHVTKWTKPQDLPAMYKLLEITPQNFHNLHDFIKKNNTQFDIVIYPEISNMLELLKTRNIFIYVVMSKDEIKCAYFYTKTRLYMESRMEILNCFGSIYDFEWREENAKNIFIHGFKISFWKIASENFFGFAAIENISHNNIIIENLIQKTKPLIQSPTAYFFYNFAYHTFKSSKTLIIN
jgi:hypothetical protein